MILSIRNSFLGRAFSFLMIFVFIITLNPQSSFALTGGPAQPEFNSFTPIGTSDMVDLASGDFSYNIPLMDVGGFPINLAYSSGITMDQEASWVGLGWDLGIGQINRQMRGIPDDFDGDIMTYENNIKDNFTVGGTKKESAELVGIKVFKLVGDEGESGSVSNDLKLNGSITAQYNSYNGISLSPSLGVSFDIAKMGSIGFNAAATPDGLVLSPSVSLNPKMVNNKKRDGNLGASFGLSFNSRQGLTSVNMSTSYGPRKPRQINESKAKYKANSVGSSKSYLPNTYTPTIQPNMLTASGTFNFAQGFEFYGGEGELEKTMFFSNQFMVKKVENKKAYGYDNTHKASEKGVLDFNREKDGVFTENSTNLPLTNYTHDLYSVKGQGVSGMFQPFRSQVGYVYSDFVRSGGVDYGLGGEVGSGASAHVGVDGEGTFTNTKAGVWKDENNALTSFEESGTEDVDYEEVYYKNVGDLSVDENLGNLGHGSGTNLGAYQPITLKIGGDEYARTLDNTYEVKNKGDWNINADQLKRSGRAKRNQNIQKIRASEAGMVNTEGKKLLPDFVENSHAEKHHTAGFIITRNDGARYNYGKALYNTTKKEVTFALGSGIGGGLADKAEGDVRSGLVPYVDGEDNSVDNKHGDHYYNSITTPAYGHTFLLTSLLSTDYADIDEISGPSAGDLGSFTKFEYRDIENPYKWRVPFQKDLANWNEGLKTDPTDDKGSYVYGVKELSYVQVIRTKTHVALFHISPREDGYGVEGPSGGIGTTSQMYKLDKVELYSVGEAYSGNYDEYGKPLFVDQSVDGDGNITTTATPIKTVHFVYDYSQCKNIPNNRINGGFEDPLDDNELDNQGGKLTLKKVYFTYRNSKMGKYSPYEFTYGDADHSGGTLSELEEKRRNPAYNLKGYDIWGCYKPNDEYGEISMEGKTLDPLTAPEFNYVEQNTIQDKNRFDDYAAAWSITDIMLPSGGKIQIDYEADDYQYVQDKKAMRMFKLAGTGYYPNPLAPTDDDVDVFGVNLSNNLASQDNNEGLLYKGAKDAQYLYFELDMEDEEITEAEFRNKYLSEIQHHQNNLVQFRVLMNMTRKGGKVNDSDWSEEPFDYVTGYFELDHSAGGSTIFTDLSTGKVYGSVKMKLVNKEGGILGSSDVNPIAKAGWQFGRKYLSRFILGGEDTDGDGGTDVVQIAKKLTQFLKTFPELYAGPNGLVKGMNIGRRIVPEKSWIRLSEPSQAKKGGGCRVKRISMTDEWARMTGSDNDLMDQVYGQEYSYELEDGGSSGVATYEPVGSKENPLVQPVFVNINRVLAPDEENYLEKPFGESFFPGPTVTYSRVSVKNLQRKEVFDGNERVVKKHATGKVVTEFYTSKDFPIQTDQTRLIVKEDHNPLLSSLLKVNIVKHLTLSQGYVVHLNDMNGKMKGQRVYAEGQDEPISGVDYEYDLYPAVDPDDYDADMAQTFNNKGRLNNKVLSLSPSGVLSPKEIGIEHTIINDFREMRSVSTTAGINYNTAGFPVGPLPIVIPVPLPDFNRHVDQLRISTTTKVINTYGIQKRTIAYDAGAVVSTRNVVWDSETGEVLVTETVNEYGDHYYSFNYPAHWNYKGMGQAAFNSGIVAHIAPLGDGYELVGASGPASDYVHPGDEMILISDESMQIAWVNSVADAGSEFSLIDRLGAPIDVDTGIIKIIRSGRRNIQSTSMGSIVMMKNPVPGAGLNETSFETTDWSSHLIVNAGAVEFNDEWDLQCECGIDVINNVYNPYLYNTLGVWRADKSYLYLTGRHHNHEGVDPRRDGFYNEFSPYYKLDADGKWSAIEDVSDSKWTFTSQVSTFSPYGFELENEDALGRKSAAQYGYNFSFPLAVGANTGYGQMGYDGFEDYYFDGCQQNEHFGFRDVEPGESNDPGDPDDAGVSNIKSHTGRYSLKIKGGNRVIRGYRTKCD